MNPSTHENVNPSADHMIAFISKNTLIVIRELKTITVATILAFRRTTPCFSQSITIGPICGCVINQ